VPDGTAEGAFEVLCWRSCFAPFWGAREFMSVLPLRPFGVSDLVWPPGVCEVCHDPEWSDALHDWEYVEAAAGPCGTCRVKGSS
jgi:hypothetical protein